MPNIHELIQNAFSENQDTSDEAIQSIMEVDEKELQTQIKQCPDCNIGFEKMKAEARNTLAMLFSTR